MRSATDQRTARRVAAVLGAVVALAGAWPSAGAAPPVQSPSEEAVDNAIARGLKFVFSRQRPGGGIATHHDNTHPGAVESLAALTALTAGRSIKEPGPAAAVAYAVRTDPQTVYARALRIILLARLGGGDNLDQVKADLTWLYTHKRLGGWGFGPGHPADLYRPARTDTVNSHLAVLALVEAAEAGLNVPAGIWKECRSYWTKAQNPDGGWGYEPAPSGRVLADSLAPTTAVGLVTMFALERKRLELSKPPPGGSDTAGEGTPALDVAAIGKAHRWLVGHYDFTTVPGSPLGKSDGWYYPYLLSFVRAAECTGARLIGTDQDRWLGRVTAALVRGQHSDGHWPAADGSAGEYLSPSRRAGQDVVRTCLATLALARCRAGVLINKLTVGKAWKTHFLDAGNLASWYERNCGQPVGWRLIDPNAVDGEFAQAPILYINVRDEFVMPDALANRAKKYVRNGGTILVHVQGRNSALAGEATQYFHKLMPDYRAERILDDHPIYHLRFEIPDDKQPLVTGIGDYCRTRIFIVNADFSGVWHANDHKTHGEAFKLAANIALYTTDGRGPGGKFHRRRPRPPKPKRLMQIARIFHEGDWATNPLASERLSDVLADAISIGIEEKPAVKLTEAVPQGLTMLWLTGTRPARLAIGQQQVLKRYVEAGGTLLVDPAIGNEAFFNDAKAMLERMFPGELERADRHSEILSGRFAGGLGTDVTTVRYTRATALKPALPELWLVEIDRRIAVVLSRYGLTCPVEGLPTYGCKGLVRDDARRLAANVTLYAAANAASRR